MDKYLLNKLKEVRVNVNKINDESYEGRKLCKDVDRCLLYVEEKMNKEKHYVYGLFKDDNIIYVGITRLDRFYDRINTHKLDKDFNGYSILSETNSKTNAISIEKALYQFIDSFTDYNILNIKGTSKEKSPKKKRLMYSNIKKIMKIF